MECELCGQEFDPVATRWLCLACGFKHSCCEGEAQYPAQTPQVDIRESV